MKTELFDSISPADPAVASRLLIRGTDLGQLHTQLVQVGPGSAQGTRSVGVRLIVPSAPTIVKPAGMSRELACEPGQLVIQSAQRLCTWEFTGPTRLCVLAVPPAQLDGLAGVYQNSDVTVLSSSVLNSAAAGFVEQLVSDLVTGRGQVDDRAEYIAVDLVRSLLEGNIGEAPGSCPAQIHAAVMAVIDRDFTDPELSAGLIADALSMSRRQLYRYYEGNPQTVSEMIASRRLEHARTLLATRPLMELSSVAAESGFTSSGTLRRRFVARYGTTPREFRAALYSPGSTALVDGSPSQPQRLVPARPITTTFEPI